MAANDRTVDLVLRAVDQTAQPIASVIARSKELITTLEQQIKLTASGATSAGDFKKALGDVTAETKLLYTQLGALRNVDSITGRFDEAIAKLNTLQQTRSTFLAGLGGNTPNDAQARQLNNMETAIERATKGASRAEQPLIALRARMEAMGVEATQVAHAQDILAAAILRTAEVSKRAQDANVGFIGNKRAAEETAKAEADRAKLATAVRTAANASEKAEYDAAQAGVRAVEKAEEKKQGVIAKANRGLIAMMDEVASAMAEFAAEVQRLDARASASMARAASATRALAGPAPTPAPTLAGQVQSRLGAGPGASAGLPDILAIRNEVADINTVLSSGTLKSREYTQELQRLNVATTELARQAGIVDAFERQRVATVAAKKAVADLIGEMLALKNQADSLKLATTDTDKAKFQEVTSELEKKQRRLGSTDDGSGVAGNAMRQIQALEEERVKLASIGLTAADVSSAISQYTTVATTAATTRTEGLYKEGQMLARLADQARQRIAASQAATSQLGGTQLASASAGDQIRAAGPSRNAGDIADTSAAVDELTQRMGKGKLSAESYNRVMDQINAVQRQIAKDGDLIDSFKRNQEAVSAATAEYNQATVNLRKYADAAQHGTATISELRAAESRFTSADAELKKQLITQTQTNAALRQRKIDTTTLDAETKKLVASSTQLAHVQESVAQSSGKIGGLTRYQYQNLSYQLNDVVTQLSLGQGLLRTLESQGGQILQIFEASGSSIFKMVALAVPVVAVILTMVAAFERLSASAQAVRTIGATLTLNVDGIGYSRDAIAATQREIARYGTSFADAGIAVKQFIADGLNENLFLKLGKLAQNLVDAGAAKDFAEALTMVKTVTSGSWEEIQKLNRELGFLTAEEAKAGQAAFETGNVERGRIEILDKLSRSAKDAHSTALGPLTILFRELKIAWDDFLKTIGDLTVIHHLVNGLGLLLQAATSAARALQIITNGVPGPGLAEYDKRLQGLKANLDIVKAAIQGMAEGRMVKDDETLKVLQDRAKELTRLIGETQASIDKLGAGGVGVPPVQGSVQGPPGGGSIPGVNLPAQSPDPKVVPADIKPIIERAADMVKVQTGLIEQLYRNEAVRRPDGSFESSPAGAQGMMQTMPETFAGLVRQFKGLFDELAAKTGHATSINDNDSSALAASLYYRQQLERFKSPLIAAGAYNMGPGNKEGTGAHPGIQGVLNGTITIPEETRKYIDRFAKGIGMDYHYSGPASLRATATGPGSNFRSDSAASITPETRLYNTANSARQRTLEQEVHKSVEDQMQRMMDPTLKGIRRAAQDEERIKQFAEDQRKTLQKAAENVWTPAMQTELDALVGKKRVEFENERNREQLEAERALADRARSFIITNLNNDKTNPVAARKAVDLSFEKEYDALAKAARDGAGEVVVGGVRYTTAQMKEAIDKAKSDRLESATLDANEAAVKAVVGARDAAIAAVTDQLKLAKISITEAYKRFTEINVKFGPQIKEVTERALADLRSVPQTPKVERRIAETERAGETAGGEKQAMEQNNISLQNTTNIARTRNDLAKSYDELLAKGVITQREHDERTQTAYAKTRDEIIKNNAELQRTIDLQRDAGIIGPIAYESIRAKMQLLNAETTTFTGITKELVDKVPNMIAANFTTALNSVADAVGRGIAGTEKWSDVWRDAGTAMLKFVADTLRGIAQVIIQFYVVAALKASTIAAVAHGGGIVGSTTMSREVDPMAFVGAMRHHGGGVVGGLAPGERPIIAMDGEEVVTKNDPRHRNNPNRYQTSGGGNKPQSIRNITVFNDAELAQALAGSHGERIVMTHIKRNGPAIRSLLGS